MPETPTTQRTGLQSGVKRKRIRSSQGPSFTDHSDYERVGGRAGTILAFLLTVSLFGPYVFGPIRVDQVVIYPAAAVATLYLIGQHYLRKELVSLVVPWIVLVIIASVGAVFPVLNRTQWPLGNALANADNLLNPLAVALSSAALVLAFGYSAIVRGVSAGVCSVMVLNVALALLQRTTGFSSGLSRFWSSGDTSVADRAITVGRYTGIITQPAVAGLLYGLAGLAALHLFRERRLVSLLIFVWLTYGGLLAASKAYYLIGFPLIAWQLLFARGSQKKHRGGVVALIMGLGLALVISGTSLGNHPLLASVRRIIPSADTTLLNTLSGNRFGERSTTLPVAQGVWETSPIFGIGLPGLSVATDSGWLQVFVLSGLLGLLLFALLQLAILRNYLTKRSSLALSESQLLLGVTILVLVGSVGFPVLTGNRVSGVVWILLIALGASVSRQSPGKRGVNDADRSEIKDSHSSRVIGSTPTRPQDRLEAASS